MADLPEFIDWHEVVKTDQERLDEFYENLGMVHSYLDRTENGLTEALIPSEKQKEWEIMCRSRRYGNTEAAEQTVLQTETSFKRAAQPILGKLVVAHTSFIEQSGDTYIADSGDYGYFPRIKGVFKSVNALRVQSRENYPKGFGDHIPGQYPKMGDFEEISFCFGIGDLFVPIRGISVRSRTLKLIDENGRIIAS